MADIEENVWPRRAFVKSALVGAAGSVIAGIGIKTGYAHIGSQQKLQGESLTRLTLSEASELVRKKRVSPVELTQACLRRIEQINPRLNTFITVTADSSLAQAREAESEIQRGTWRGPLHGFPNRTPRSFAASKHPAQCSLASRTFTNSPTAAVR